MPFQPVPDCARIEIRANSGGIAIENTLNAQFAGAILQADIDELTEVVDEFVGENFLPVWSASLTYIETYARALDGAIDVESTNNANAGVGGSIVEPEPNNVSFPIKFTTGLTGRSARGRNYWMGMVTNQTFSPSTADAGFVAGVVALYEGLFAAMLTVGWTAVIVQRYANNVLLTNGIPRPITDVGYSSLKLASMRGRLK